MAESWVSELLLQPGVCGLCHTESWVSPGGRVFGFAEVYQHLHSVLPRLSRSCVGGRFLEKVICGALDRCE